MPGSTGFVGALLVAAAAAAAPAAAQPLSRQPRTVPSPTATLPALQTTVSPGAAFLMSAVLPGAGQYVQGADRWFPYLVVEAWSVFTFLDQRAEARAFERRYRDLAWSVARRGSTPPRRDSVFEYYEDMTRFGASGLYDADTGQPGVQPERDLETFNGELWGLARALFVDPQQALAYYESRAIAASFSWAWGDSNLERQVFVELIRESDEAFRHATTALGILVANHMVSAIDALVLARLRSARTGERRLRVWSGLESGVAGVRWTSALSVRF